MSASIGRRQVLTGSGASLLALALAAPARAALPGAEELKRLLGTGLPQQLRGMLPTEAFEAAGFVQDLLRLEAEAKALRLPRSALSLGQDEIPLDPERLYEIALPRLVALVDRAELRNLTFADKVGALLAKLHDTQHVVPEGWAAAAEPQGPPLRPLGFAPQPQPEGALAVPEGIATPAAQPVVQPLPETPEPPEQQPAVLGSPSRSLRFADLEQEYRSWFAAMELRAEHQAAAQWHLTMMRQSRARYASAGKRSGVPWYFIAAIHGLEASFNFRAHFHNGDFPLTRRTRQVPAGRPRVWLPPSDWESSTVDALRLMGFTNETDWSLPRTLYRLEAFNGFGYRRMGRPTPYLWSFSQHYGRGKFVADGRYDPAARSQQCGTAVMLKLLANSGELNTSD